MVKDGVTGYRFFPHRARGEGFFLSVIRKMERDTGTRMKSKNILSPPPKMIQERLREWLAPDVPVAFFQFNDLIFFTPQSREKEFEFLLQNFKIVYAGTNAASRKHDKLIPDQALALSLYLSKGKFQTADLPESEAIRYLRKDEIRLDNAPIGFTLITYGNLPLGWVNVLPNRVNNMYPSDWRIRMNV